MFTHFCCVLLTSIGTLSSHGNGCRPIRGVRGSISLPTGHPFRQKTPPTAHLTTTSSSSTPFLLGYGGRTPPSSLLQHHSETRRGGRRGSDFKSSTDPQSAVARLRRHRISDRFRILKSLVPGGSKLDTVSMLEEAINYVKFLKAQIWFHQAALMLPSGDNPPISFLSTTSSTPTISDTPTLGSSGSVFTPSCAFSSSSSHELPSQQMLGYSMPPPTPPLPPFPCSSFQGEEEEMLPQVCYNYHNFWLV